MTTSAATGKARFFDRRIKQWSAWMPAAEAQKQEDEMNYGKGPHYGIFTLETAQRLKVAPEGIDGASWSRRGAN